jgi:glutamate decarboxylase
MGIDVPIHVDGASGALFCPFATPSVKFGFQIPRVKSINVYFPFADVSDVWRSGHKYGLVYPGVGWVVWRNEKELPDHLKFELDVLGGNFFVEFASHFMCSETYTLTFSRPGAHVVAQYYNFIHLGFDGYAAVQKKCLQTARFISIALEGTGCIFLSFCVKNRLCVCLINS